MVAVVEIGFVLLLLLLLNASSPLHLMQLLPTRGCAMRTASIEGHACNKHLRGRSVAGMYQRYGETQQTVPQ
jgi:hypothetical protein